VLATFTGSASTTSLSNSTPTNHPIADGSARAYCRMIETAGISPQPEKREPYKATVRWSSR